MEVDIPSEYVYLCGRWTEKYFNQKCFFFFIDLPISDELAALPFGFLLFQFPKISNDVSTNQPISDEFGTSLFGFSPRPRDESKYFLLRLRSKDGPQSYPWRHFSRSQPGLLHLVIRELGS